MALLTSEIEALIGMESEEVAACDVVERGAVRRFAQASLDDDPIYYDPAVVTRYGGPVAPPLFPMTMFRDDFGMPDVLSERATDPHFDGIVGATVQGLPPVPVKEGLALLNGGTQVEFFAYARHGERITAKSRYDAIYEKAGKSGPMLFVVIATDYRAAGRLLLRVRKTQIRR